MDWYDERRPDILGMYPPGCRILNSFGANCLTTDLMTPHQIVEVVRFDERGNPNWGTIDCFQCAVTEEFNGEEYGRGGWLVMRVIFREKLPILGLARTEYNYTSQIIVFPHCKWEQDREEIKLVLIRSEQEAEKKRREIEEYRRWYDSCYP